MGARACALRAYWGWLLLRPGLRKTTRPRDWRVTLTKTECGLKTIAKALPNPAWDGGDDKPEYVAAKADPGKDFCIVYWDWETSARSPGSPTLQAT